MSGLFNENHPKEHCIKCNVENCTYHNSQNDTCDAEKISVGGHDACSCRETCCNTFQAKM
ncbi:MAG: DUF1540 domain-containing protein [Clostridia bacterium]|nr:DUF1540 domain-containing protein [Clostridia bacterium]